jgi:hypothetical protein
MAKSLRLHTVVNEVEFLGPKRVSILESLCEEVWSQLEVEQNQHFSAALSRFLVSHIVFQLADTPSFVVEDIRTTVVSFLCVRRLRDFQAQSSRTPATSLLGATTLGFGQ